MDKIFDRLDFLQTQPKIRVKTLKQSQQLIDNLQQTILSLKEQLISLEHHDHYENNPLFSDYKLHPIMYKYESELVRKAISYNIVKLYDQPYDKAKDYIYNYIITITYPEKRFPILDDVNAENYILYQLLKINIQNKNKVYSNIYGVFERHKNNRIHSHFCINLDEDYYEKLQVVLYNAFSQSRGYAKYAIDIQHIRGNAIQYINKELGKEQMRGHKFYFIKEDSLFSLDIK